MELVVVDASVAAKWVLTEPDTHLALDFLNDPVRRIAPSLIRVEVAGAVLRQLRTDTMTCEQAKAAVTRWDRLASSIFVQLIDQEELLDNAITMALSIRHTVPDCFYLAAARQFDCRLITADRTLHERGRKLHDNIELLAQAA